MSASFSEVFSNTRALFFDFDGTLVDSVPDLALAINKTLAQLGRPQFLEEDIRQWVGNGPELLVARALSGSVDIDPALEKNFIASTLRTYHQFYERDICVNSCLYPGVKATLEQFAGRFPMVIITNKSERFVEPILQGLGISGVFDLILGGDSLAKKKPDAAPLLYAAEKLNQAVINCAMIGDSKNDILAAKAAKMPCVGVSYGYNYGEPIAVYEPDCVVDNFSDLLSLFTKA